NRQDVVLLAAVGGVAVGQVAELLEDVERAVDGRRGRVRVPGPAAVDELRSGHVALGAGDHVEDEPPLGRPAETARAKLLPNVVREARASHPRRHVARTLT